MFGKDVVGVCSVKTKAAGRSAGVSEVIVDRDRDSELEEITA